MEGICGFDIRLWFEIIGWRGWRGWMEVSCALLNAMKTLGHGRCFCEREGNE